MRMKHVIAMSILAVAAPLSAQDQDQAETTEAVESGQTAEAENAPIVVTADKREQRTAFVGSRIPRRATFVDGPIATSTGTRGLTPQSGMDQAGRYTRTKRSRDCVSDNLVLSKAASCIMADAQEAFVAGDMPAANDRYAIIAGGTQFAPAEQLEAARWQYRIAQETGNDEAREGALLAMVETGAMGEEQELSARRNLIGMAAISQRDPVTIERLQDLDSTGDARATDLVQLAIIMRRMELSGAEDVMFRAIAMQEESGKRVPQGWQDFADRVGL